MLPTRRITTSGGDVFRDEFSLAFDGTDNFIDLGSQSGDLRLSGSNGAIISWIKPTLTGDDFQRIVDKSSSGNANSGYALVFETNGRISGYIDVATTVITGTGVLVANKWQQITWTWDGTTHFIYVNGKLIASNTNSTQPPSDTTNMRIGTWNHDVSREYNGNMSEVVIYNKGLSASEVKTLYNGREPYNHKEGVCSSNLLAWYRMGDGLLDGNRTFSHTQSSDDSTQDNIISDESNSGLGAELYTFANALSTSAHESTNITSDGTSDYANGFRAFTGTTVELESSITSNSSHALKYTSDGSNEGFRIDLSEHVDDSGNGLDVGSVYQISVDVRHIGTGDGNAVNSVRLAENSGMGTTGETLVLFNISKNMTTYRNYKAYFIYDDTTTRYFGAREANSDNDSGGLYIDNLSIKKVSGNAGIMNNFSFEAIEGDTP